MFFYFSEDVTFAVYGHSTTVHFSFYTSWRNVNEITEKYSRNGRPNSLTAGSLIKLISKFLSDFWLSTGRVR